MRYSEFKSRQQIDEVAPLIPILMYGGAAAMSAWEARNIYKDYKSGKITKDQALARAGITAGTTLAGGMLGKMVAKGGSGAYNLAKNIFKFGKKDKPDIPKLDTPDVPKVVGKTKDGSNVVQSKSGNLTKQGADGKPTTQLVKPKDMVKAPKAPKAPKAKTATATGAAVGAGAKKVPTPTPKPKPKAPLSKGKAAGTLAGAAAGVTASQLASKLADFRKQQDAKRAQQTQTGVLYKGKASGPKSMVDIK